jgi:ribosome-binding factor A
MAGERRARAERAYAEAFSEVLRDLKTPLPALCSVVRVDMSPDLRSARVHLSMYGDRNAQATSRRLIERARSFLQSETGRRVGLRFTPNLSVVPDQSISEVVRLGALMHEQEDEGHGNVVDDDGRSGPAAPR